MTNTERLIRAFEHGQKFGHQEMTFAVGRYTGNGIAVVEALRRRGYSVERNLSKLPQSYTVRNKLTSIGAE